MEQSLFLVFSLKEKAESVDYYTFCLFVIQFMHQKYFPAS